MDLGRVNSGLPSFLSLDILLCGMRFPHCFLRDSVRMGSFRVVTAALSYDRTSGRSTTPVTHPRRRSFKSALPLPPLLPGFLRAFLFDPSARPPASWPGSPFHARNTRKADQTCFHISLIALSFSVPVRSLWPAAEDGNRFVYNERFIPLFFLFAFLSLCGSQRGKRPARSHTHTQRGCFI